MILDTSALVAVLDGEIEADRIAVLLAEADRLAISAPTVVELTAVLTRYERPEVHATLERALQRWGVEVVAFDAAQARVAQQAYRDYGRGSGHAARLNLGDCYSYALAVVRDEALLVVGDDFGHTDVRVAMP